MIGNNQPLIVIDGIITNNETLNSGSSTAGTATSNRLMDLNNDDIESINILKGSAATALYGTAGAPGVIVITTKKGEEGEMKVSYTHSTGVIGFQLLLIFKMNSHKDETEVDLTELHMEISWNW